MEQSQPLKIFISYAQKDANFLSELEKHLSILQRNGLLSAWNNQKIDAGSIASEIIEKELKESQLILLLISADYLSSDYQYNWELKTAIELHKENKAIVIPILLRACYIKGTPFAQLQALPKNLVPINSWEKPDKAYLDIVSSITQWLKAVRNISFNKSNTNRFSHPQLYKRHDLKILFLGSSPYDTTRIMYGKEYRKIRQIVKKNKTIDYCEVIPELDVDIATLQQVLLEEQPTIVHFSGPGTEDRNGIVLHDKVGESDKIQGNHLADLLGFVENIECVIFNTIISQVQAGLISNDIEYVIGIKELIKEEACIYFSEGFYQGLIRGKSYEASFKLGLNYLNIRGLGEEGGKYFMIMKEK